MADPSPDSTKAPGPAPDEETEAGKPKPPKPRRKWLRRTLAGIGIFAALSLIAGIVVVVVGYQTTTLPDPNADFRTQTTFVYYNDGKAQMGSFAVQNRQPLTFEQMPEEVKDAVVAAENRTFWTDRGISFRGLIRSAWVILRGGELQGGSTITQQYIKILYLNSEQTLTRKFRELFLAYKLTNQLSKEQILEGYLNTIYFGRGAYGIQAAAKAYFKVNGEDLTVPQAAVLASVINNPSLFDPSVEEDNAERLLGRYQYVIDSMGETGAITTAQAAEYRQELPEFPEVPINQRYGGPRGFLLKMVERELNANGFTPGQISGGGLRITTTFDKEAQNAAVAAAQTYTKEAAGAAGKKASGLHAAIASVNVGTGEVIALYGGPDFVKNSRNWATTARPTASTFKSYALAAGLDDEFSLKSKLNGNTFRPPGDITNVRNEFSLQYGPVTLLKATSDSINTAFVDLTTKMKDGPQKVMEMAEAVGAPKGAGWDDNSRVALGTAEVSPLNQANAYATFANNGIYVATHVVKEVHDANGKLLYQAHPEQRRAITEDVARDVTYALSSVVEQGTGRRVQTLSRPVAGKTGTKDVEDDIVSAWFVAYTKQISTAVMFVAGDDGNGDLDDYARPGDATFFGGTYPALTWADYMTKATKGQPVEKFDPPANVNSDKVPTPAPTRSSVPPAAPSSAPPSSAPPKEPPKEPPPSSEAPSEPPPSTEPGEPPSEEPGDEPTPGG